MLIISKPSPHYRWEREAPIDTLVIHYISAVNILPDDPFNIDEIIKLLTEPIPIGNDKSVKVSAHYLIGRDGIVYKIVDEERVAWHAGKSSLRGRSIRNSVNDFSIGIEMVGGKWIGFTNKQYDSLSNLTKNAILMRNEIPKENIVGHEDVSPGRKFDPGKHFDWDRYLNTVFEEHEKNEEKLTRNKEKIVDQIITEGGEEEVKIENNITEGKEDSVLMTIINAILSLFKGKK